MQQQRLGQAWQGGAAREHIEPLGADERPCRIER
jgi:hypothetical protein